MTTPLMVEELNEFRRPQLLWRRLDRNSQISIYDFQEAKARCDQKAELWLRAESRGNLANDAAQAKVARYWSRWVSYRDFAAFGFKVAKKRQIYPNLDLDIIDAKWLRYGISVHDVCVLPTSVYPEFWKPLMIIYQGPARFDISWRRFSEVTLLEKMAQAQEDLARELVGL